MSNPGLTTETNASKEIALINELITGPPANALLEKSNVYNTTSEVRILDMGTGVGNLLFRFFDASANRATIHRAVGLDIDKDYIRWLNERANETGYPIESILADQASTGLAATEFTHVFGNFSIIFAPDSAAVLTESLRLLQSGGAALFSSWHKLAWWDELVVKSIEQNLPGAPPLPNPMGIFKKSGWTEGESAETKLKEAGFVDVRSELLAFTPQIEPEKFAAAGSHLVKSITGRAWDLASREKYEPLIEKAFLDYLNTEYGGKWTGKCTALLTWGTKP